MFRLAGTPDSAASTDGAVGIAVQKFKEFKYSACLTARQGADSLPKLHMAKSFTSVADLQRCPWLSCSSHACDLCQFLAASRPLQICLVPKFFDETTPDTLFP
jgi:hypothetical protein